MIPRSDYKPLSEKSIEVKPDFRDDGYFGNLTETEEAQLREVSLDNVLNQRTPGDPDDTYSKSDFAPGYWGNNGEGGATIAKTFLCDGGRLETRHYAVDKDGNLVLRKHFAMSGAYKPEYLEQLSDAQLEKFLPEIAQKFFSGLGELNAYLAQNDFRKHSPNIAAAQENLGIGAPNSFRYAYEELYNVRSFDTDIISTLDWVSLYFEYLNKGHKLNTTFGSGIDLDSGLATQARAAASLNAETLLIEPVQTDEERAAERAAILRDIADDATRDGQYQLLQEALSSLETKPTNETNDVTLTAIIPGDGDYSVVVSFDNSEIVIGGVKYTTIMPLYQKILELKVAENMANSPISATDLFLAMPLIQRQAEIERTPIRTEHGYKRISQERINDIRDIAYWVAAHPDITAVKIIGVADEGTTSYATWRRDKGIELFTKFYEEAFGGEMIRPITVTSEAVTHPGSNKTKVGINFEFTVSADNISSDMYVIQTNLEPAIRAYAASYRDGATNSAEADAVTDALAALSEENSLPITRIVLEKLSESFDDADKLIIALNGMMDGFRAGGSDTGEIRDDEIDWEDVIDDESMEAGPHPDAPGVESSESREGDGQPEEIEQPVEPPAEIDFAD